MTGPKPDKSPEAQKLRSSLRYVQDIRDQLSAVDEVGDTLRGRKLKRDLNTAIQSSHEVADAYRASRKSRE